MRQPLVSICAPTRNRAPFLRTILAMACRQTYAPLEILILDNASTDETEAICREVQAQDERVRYLRHPEDIGVYRNHNAGIEASQGEFICFFHDDDLYEPEMVSEYVAFLQHHPEVALLCSDWELIGEQGEVIGQRIFRGPEVMPGMAYIDQTIHSGRSSLNCAGTMIRRAALGEVRFDEEGPLGFGDFVVWFEIAEIQAVGHLPQRLWRNRIHRGALSSRTIVGMAHDYWMALSRYCERYVKRWPDHADCVTRWHRWIHEFLFWALVYEVGRHFRQASGDRGRTIPARTIFDLAGYRLSEAELQEALSLLKIHQSGWLQGMVRATMESLIELRWPQPLAWAASYVPRLRSLRRFS